MVSVRIASMWLVLTTLSHAACGPRTPQPLENPRAIDPTIISGRGGEATLLLMADVRGVLRPCGCTPELQKGGFDRLIPVLAAERQRAPANLVLHAGPMFHEEFDVHSRKRQQHVRQAEVAAALFELAKIDVAGAHPVDAQPDPGAWPELIKRSGAAVLATNVSNFRGDLKRWEIRSVGGLAIGIFALAPEAGSETTPGWDVGAPLEAAREAVAALSGKVDAVIMLSGLGLRETKRLLRVLEGVDFAVVGGMGDHPTVSDEAELIGKTRIFQFHREGRYLGRLVLRRAAGDALPFVDGSVASAAEIADLEKRIASLAGQIASAPQGNSSGDRVLVGLKHQHNQLQAELTRVRARHQTVAPGQASFSFRLVSVDWDLPQAEAPLSMMNAFDTELAGINVANAGTLPEPLPGQAVYVGVDTCLSCHTETTSFWNVTRHSHAWETLEKVNKTFDAGCVSCHVTGYEQAGGSLVGHTEGREDVQCESCHGPGSKHVGDGRPSSILRAPTVDACVGCHNQHHSPGFDFDAYRARLLVPGHGRPLGP